MSFTPGPWQAERQLTSYDEPVIHITARDASLSTGTREVAEVWPDTRTIDLDEANAHLIAAAPDLYEALESLQALGLPEPHASHVHAALLKARGEPTS